MDHNHHTHGVPGYIGVIGGLFGFVFSRFIDAVDFIESVITVHPTLMSNLNAVFMSGVCAAFGWGVNHFLNKKYKNKN